MARRRDDEDDDDRPRSRRPREDDDEDEPRPRRKSRPVEDDDEDDRPRRRARTRDEEDEDDRPRRRKPKPAGMSKGLLFGLIGGGVALVAVVVLLILFVGGSSPKSAYEGFVKAARSSDFATVYDSLDRETQSAFDAEMRRAADRDPTGQAKALAGKELFVFAMTEAKGKGMVLPIPTSDPKILDEEIDGNSASLRLVSDQGKMFTVKLVREGRKWKVSLIGQMRKS